MQVTHCSSLGSSIVWAKRPARVAEARAPLSMEALSREWDGASKPQRLRLLEHLADTSPREHFADASAQLFFLRIVTALKIAYVVGSPISAHLNAIATFFDASLGARFQTQFVQAGGMRTILHLISTNSNERESALALRLLLLVAQCGRTAKESICEHNGISCVVDCVLSEPSADAQELARDLLIEFGCGNPQYVASVRNGLLCLLSSTRLPAQRIAAQVINGFISPESPSHIPAELFNYPAAFVPSIIAMLSCEVSVRYEALNMLQQLVRARASTATERARA